MTDPTDVVTDPRNGDVYVTESHTDMADPNLVARISVFDRNGKFLRTIGKTGSGPGEFRTPHALEFDSQGRLIVADRHNHRIQILTPEGKSSANTTSSVARADWRLTRATLSTQPTQNRAKEYTRVGREECASGASKTGR